MSDSRDDGDHLTRRELGHERHGSRHRPTASEGTGGDQCVDSECCTGTKIYANVCDTYVCEREARRSTDADWGQRLRYRTGQLGPHNLSHPCFLATRTDQTTTRSAWGTAGPQRTRRTPTPGQ